MFIWILAILKIHPELYTSMDSSYSTSPRMSPAMKNIQDKCGVMGSDLLWTTAMEKISDCLDARLLPLEVEFAQIATAYCLRASLEKE